MSSQEITTGVSPLYIDGKKSGYRYISRQYRSDRPAALALVLHGAGAPAEQGLSLLQRYAEEENIILIAPASKAYSWDIIADKAYGQDVAVIDRALALVFAQYTLNPARLAIGGFSDGASYALSLGLTNGDLFTHVIAFSPGFAYAPEKYGAPFIFVSHGTHDQVLPIDSCSRRIVPLLQQQQLAVTYTEFDGKHEVPAAIAARAIAWFTGNSQTKV